MGNMGGAVSGVWDQEVGGSARESGTKIVSRIGPTQSWRKRGRSEINLEGRGLVRRNEIY